MIYIQIKEVMKAKRLAWGRRITLSELAKSTGISRMTLSRMVNNKGYSTVTDHLDKLCAYFECELHELIKYVPDNQSHLQTA
ncbi:MAG: helix-turn-helix domain-containing protein [Methylophilaceae bacterium]